jgi:3-oxoacyl-[acyl-carrier protein] reductase
VNDLDFTGKTVLVVGGSSGIGTGVAQAFHAHGATTHVWGTRPSADAYSAEDGSDLTGLHYAQMDASDFARLEAYKPPFERLDTLITAQGTVAYNRKEFGLEIFRKVLDVNLTSVMACCLKFEAMLAASAGSVVIFGSIAGFHSTKGNPAYAASKTGVVGLTRTLGEAWAKKIRVNSVAPGLVDTKLTAVTTRNPERLAANLRKIPLGRLGTPAEMAGPAMFLASDLARYIVGQTILVDGGRLL